MTDRLLERAAFHEAGHAIAALTFGIPIIRITIAADVPHLHRARYQPPHSAGLECLATLCLSGPAAERLFCGTITDGANQADVEMARRYLADRFDPLRIGVELARLRDAADRLTKTISVPIIAARHHYVRPAFITSIPR